MSKGSMSFPKKFPFVLCPLSRDQKWGKQIYSLDKHLVYISDCETKFFPKSCSIDNKTLKVLHS
jgi:hypothetical protein